MIPESVGIVRLKNGKKFNDRNDRKDINDNVVGLKWEGHLTIERIGRI